MGVINKSRQSAGPELGRADWVKETARGVANTVDGAEQLLLPASTCHIDQFRQRHPWLYGTIAFILAGGLAAVFVMTTYKNWSYESIDLKAALYRVVFSGVGAGIGAVILAFLYAAALRTTLPPEKSARRGGPPHSL